jgi:rare lipoprotein A
VFRLRRFRWKRRRAALALLPAAAMMVATGFTAAATGAGTAETTDAGDVTVKVKRHAKRGSTVEITGEATRSGGKPVTVKVNGRPVETTRSDDDGDFRVNWRPPRAGVYRVKAILGDDLAKSRPDKVNVYRPAQASYYGPGLYGNGTACGGSLTPSRVGVAHRTLPCGTKLTLRHHGRSVKVRVIDRGPFAGNREYDLTAATKAKLGFGSTGTVLTTR